MKWDPPVRPLEGYIHVKLWQSCMDWPGLNQSWIWARVLSGSHMPGAVFFTSAGHHLIQSNRVATSFIQHTRDSTLAFRHDYRQFCRNFLNLQEKHNVSFGPEPRLLKFSVQPGLKAGSDFFQVLASRVHVLRLVSVLRDRLQNLKLFLSKWIPVWFWMQNHEMSIFVLVDE